MLTREQTLNLARDLYEKSEQLCKEKKYPEAILEITNSITTLESIDLENQDEAFISHYWQILSTHQNFAGHIYFDQPDNDKHIAIDWYLRAIASLEKITKPTRTDIDYKSCCQVNIANVYKLLTNPTEFTNWLKLGITTREKILNPDINDWRWILENQYRLIDVYVRLQNHTESLSWLNKAKLSWKNIPTPEINDWLNYANIYLMSAKLLARLHQHTESLSDSKTSLDIIHQHVPITNAWPILNDVYINLATSNLTTNAIATRDYLYLALDDIIKHRELSNFNGTSDVSSRLHSIYFHLVQAQHYYPIEKSWFSHMLNVVKHEADPSPNKFTNFAFILEIICAPLWKQPLLSQNIHFIIGLKLSLELLSKRFGKEKSADEKLNLFIDAIQKHLIEAYTAYERLMKLQNLVGTSENLMTAVVEKLHWLSNNNETMQTQMIKMKAQMDAMQAQMAIMQTQMISPILPSQPWAFAPMASPPWSAVATPVQLTRATPRPPSLTLQHSIFASTPTPATTSTASAAASTNPPPFTNPGARTNAKRKEPEGGKPTEPPKRQKK